MPVGNPSPDFADEVRPGPNFFTNTVLELDAKTGAYIRHYPIMERDWHDWDVSNAPALVTTRGGKELVTFAPKDGHLYGFDRNTGQRLYRNPVYSGVTTRFWSECDAVCGPSEWRLWGITNCGKGEPMQVARVGHGCAPARFRRQKLWGA